MLANKDPLVLALYAAVGVALLYGYKYVSTDREEYGGPSDGFEDKDPDLKGDGIDEDTDDQSWFDNFWNRNQGEDQDLDGGLSPNYREL
jgi:hypothetical protein